jgi:hypothetical protein
MISVIFLTGCFQTDDTNNQNYEQYDENQIFGLLMNNRVGSSTILEIMSDIIDFWKEQGINAYRYGEFVTYNSDDIYEVGFSLNVNGDIFNYGWEYNIVTDEETAISDSAKLLYDDSWYESLKNALPDIPKPSIININALTHPTRLYIFGIIENVASESIEFCKLTATLYDSNNNITATDWIYATPTIIVPGQKACFDILFSGISSNYHYEVQIDSFINHGLIPYDDIQVTVLNDEITSLGYEITGFVENFGSSNLTYMTLRGAAYDETGQIIDLSSALFIDDNSLLAGQSKEFNLIFYRWNVKSETIASYEIYIDNMIR